MLMWGSLVGTQRSRERLRQGRRADLLVLSDLDVKHRGNVKNQGHKYVQNDMMCKNEEANKVDDGPVAADPHDG
eukprot:CAMPEP_0194498536 /NCGR_PEP_ID=MMETSP0253-20130528/15141_1 /TAXON_ID=2966 /ORGANISM="Noctiluca scintillans" /LENGTH=73 /DNA_ID=CAMNT_0039340191 /DNA_START=280 /DNA_END=498 /DNA_ORIENTATION=+